jgi:hypothetical protein
MKPLPDASDPQGLRKQGFLCLGDGSATGKAAMVDAPRANRWKRTGIFALQGGT